MYSGRKCGPLVGTYSSEGYSMVETSLSIMAFFEWRFALASLQKGPKTSGDQMANVDFAAN